MRHRRFRYTLSAFVMLGAILACVLPGQAPQTAPITDTDKIQTAIAGTAQVAAQQTEQANSTLVAAMITDTPTPTPKVSSSGTSLAYLADGSTQFVDHVAGIQMVYPAGWLVVRVGEQEYYTAWGKPETQKPEFLDVFAAMQNLDPKVFRMSALDIRSDRFLYNDITQINVIFNQDDKRTLKQIRSYEIANHPPLKNYKLLASNYLEMPQGFQALNLEYQWKTSNGASDTGKGYQRRLIFMVPAGSVAIDLSIVLDKKDLTMPDFDQLINGIVLVTP